MTKTITVGKAHQPLSNDIALSDSASLAAPTCDVDNSSTQDSVAIREEDIRILAHAKWEAAGCPSGDGVDFWLQAEQELTAK